MKKRILCATLAALMGMTLFVALLAAGSVYAVSRKDAIRSNLRDAQAISAILNADGDITGALSAYAEMGIRVTLIGADGTVELDSEASPDAMENHATREEFIRAQSDGVGEATRRSATLGEEYLYSAVRLSDGRVLRVARDLRTVEGLLLSMRGMLLLSLLAAAALSVLIARFTANALTKPLEKLDLEHPEDNVCYEELAPLLRRLGKQQRELRQRLENEQTRVREIETVTGAMREGLILLNGGWRVLAANASARRLLEIEGEPKGAHIMALRRSSELAALMDAAQAGRAASGTLRISSAVLEARLSPVGEGEPAQGYVLLLTDVTDRQDAERARREFSANVSHEMMTPLTAISGYAELIESGMASPEDVGGFAGKILTESRRMTALVEDVMRLSRLDEGNVRDKWEEVNLLSLAKETADSLAEKAREMNVQMTVRGEAVTVNAVRQLVWEILYNLAENAIKYNVRGGSVEISIMPGGFCVTDTGIGIPPEQQEKVFERFYRVEKSHSKKIGGTGLGLSIVRHAAEYLGADLSLKSRMGEGTEVSVRFK